MPRANRYFMPNCVWHITTAVTSRNFYSNLYVVESASDTGIFKQHSVAVVSSKLHCDIKIKESSVCYTAIFDSKKGCLSRK